jgi:hypothetical protein
MHRQYPAKPQKAIQKLADGGLVGAIKARMFGPQESISERYARQDAERAARAPQPAPAPPPAQPQAQAQAAFNPMDARAVLERRERAAGLANGGFPPKAELVEGPGTGISDDIPATVDENTFVMPSDSVDVMLSNGEATFPPETLAAIGAAVLEILREATHTPAEVQEQLEPEPAVEEEPVAGYADGGLVDENQRRADLIAQIPSSGPSPVAAAPAGPIARAAATVPLQPIAPISPSTAGAGRGFDSSPRTAGGAQPAFVPGNARQQLAESSTFSDSPTLATSQASNVGYGVQRIPGGSSPLFTDGRDPAGDERMMARDALMSPQNQSAFDRLGDRQQAESTARVQLGMRNEQEAREVADAQRINAAVQLRYNPPTNRMLTAQRLALDQRTADANMQLNRDKLTQDDRQFGAKQQLDQSRFGFDVSNAKEQEGGRNARAMLTYSGDVERARIAAGAKSGAPKDYRWTADGTSLEPIPGGPADYKRQGAFNADNAQLTGAMDSFSRLGVAANALMEAPGLKGITGWRGRIPNAPGSDAANAAAQLGTLRSQIGFGVLQDMRNNSKTGGALGSVSDAEGKRLEANLAALDESQSPEAFKAGLKNIIQYSEDAKERARGAFNLRHGEGGADAPRQGIPRRVQDASGYNALPSGTRFVAPDGSVRIKP